MGLFNKIFKSSGSSNAAQTPTLQFGRYTDSYKNPEKVKKWTESDDAFKAKDYLKSYDSFFNYLGDDAVQNVNYSNDSTSVKFEFMQGSKIINGVADKEKVIAEVSVAKAEKMSVAFMRKLMEMNYNLRYSRYCLKDSTICMKFFTTVLDGNPQKLYYGLKEMANSADRHDDLLVDEFSSLQMVDNHHVQEIPITEKQVKWKYFQRWMKETLDRVKGLDAEKFSGANSYLLLDLSYKIDYLISPGGAVTERLEKIHRLYFAKDGKTTQDKNKAMISELEELQKISEHDFYKSIYRVKSTFGMVNPVPHTDVANLIQNEQKNMPWYRDNNYPDIAVAVLEYIPGYSMFYYGMHKPTRQLMHLFFETVNPDYFIELGVPVTVVTPASKLINKDEMQKRIRSIISEGVKQYPKLTFNEQTLKWENQIEFLNSYLNF